MKKQTKQRLMAVFILALMAMSSIAYVFYGAATPPQQLNPLTSFVVEGDIDPQLESVYFQNGWTFLKLYHNGTLDPQVMTFLNEAPNTFTTTQNQVQMVVQKLNSTRNFAVISNFNGENTINNVTIDNIYSGLCSALVVMPAECALIGLNS